MQLFKMSSNSLALTLPGNFYPTPIIIIENFNKLIKKKAISKKYDNMENPFKIPVDTDILMLREKEKKQKLHVF